MGSKANRRARKKTNREKKKPTCERCGYPAPSGTGDHNTQWSANGVTWDGLAIVAWCVCCGWDVSS